jgi:hypothetical protein
MMKRSKNEMSYYDLCELLDGLFQMEDPNGGCPIQVLRLKFAGKAGHDSANTPKKTHIREELVRSIRG